LHLYEISERYKNIMATIENDDSFDEETLRQNLLEVTTEFNDKVESVGKIIIGLNASVTSLKTESDRLSQRAKVAQNRVDWLKNYLIVELVNAKVDKVQGQILNVTMKNNPPSCKVLDETLIPVAYSRN
jgi:hypothetical protein